LASLIAELPEGTVVTDPDILESYRQDRAVDPGTGLSGGATALTGGIVLTTEKMRDISVDPVTRTAVVQPGLLNAEVKKAVAEYGL
jgi:glycolate dehydrogenase FAD-linked subunit